MAGGALASVRHLKGEAGSNLRRRHQERAARLKDKLRAAVENAWKSLEKFGAVGVPWNTPRGSLLSRGCVAATGFQPRVGWRVRIRAAVMQPTRSATVREFAAKLRITAAVLGCASQKDLCAQFRRVNPGTTFDLERSYKWMQGRALPRSAKLYDDWALLLGTERPPAYLQSCTADEFLDLACDRFGLSREALVARAGLDVAPRPEMAEQRNAPTGHHGTPPIAAPHVATDKPSIAVLPFTNMSGDPEQAYFADGITDDVTIELARFRELSVTGPNSSIVHRDKAANPQQIGRELGVQYLLEGGVRKLGSRVRITAQLIDTATGAHVWAERYDRDIQDIFDVQDEITGTIVTTLTGHVMNATKARAKGAPPSSWRAYDCFLMGMECYGLPLARENLSRAIEFFQKAIETDPQYARAYGKLGASYTLLAVITRGDHDARARAMASAQEYARIGVSLDGSDADALLALGYVLLWNGSLAEGEHVIERAYTLNPHNVDIAMSYVSALARPT